MKNLHNIDFNEREKEIIEEIGPENKDYAICAVFEYRNENNIDYDEEEGVIKIENDGVEIKQTVEMITDVAETSDPVEKIGVGVSMLEVAAEMEKKFLLDNETH